METKTCSKCSQSKPASLFSKRSKSPDGLFCWCKECTKDYREANKARSKLQQKAWRVKNKEKLAEDKRKWREENREAYNEQMARARAKPSNKAKKAGLVRKRQAAKIKRTPSWADAEAISAFYIEAKRLEALTGIKFHVDHIIPLQGELVSGLHVETNLQLLPECQNLSKSNSFCVS